MTYNAVRATRSGYKYDLIFCTKASVEKKTVFKGTVIMGLWFRRGQRLLNPEKMSDR